MVSLHVNLCEETIGLFGPAEFARMKPGAWFVNTSRGELVDEAALVQALHDGQLAGAALDVLCQESSSGMSDNPLVAYARTHPNVIVSPHIGGCTRESMEKAETYLASLVTASLSQLVARTPSSPLTSPAQQQHLRS